MPHLDNQCSLWGYYEENVEHLFHYCDNARAVREKVFSGFLHHKMPNYLHLWQLQKNNSFEMVLNVYKSHYLLLYLEGCNIVIFNKK